jgi:hypothetical protein
MLPSYPYYTIIERRTKTVLCVGVNLRVDPWSALQFGFNCETKGQTQRSAPTEMFVTDHKIYVSPPP